MAARLVPGWLRGYQRAWLTRDVFAGLIVWSVVTPQAVAYAQIAGLPPSAGLVAAPGALLAYALLGTSRTLVVSATTATSALSAAAVAPLADGDTARFAALSAGLAVISAVVIIGAGLLRLGGVMDLVSKPVMTGFLFGLGLTVAIGQLPKIFGVEAGTGDFFEKLWALLGDLGETHGWTLAVGVSSVALLVALARLAPQLPGTLIVLVLAIVTSAALDLAGRGVDVVGNLPSAVPDPSWPDISWRDAADLLPAALGVLIVSAEAVGVSRAIAGTHGYRVDANRDLIAIGGSNLLAGLSAGFVQSGGASQTMAAERAGGRTRRPDRTGRRAPLRRAPWTAHSRRPLADRRDQAAEPARGRRARTGSGDGGLGPGRSTSRLGGPTRRPGDTRRRPALLRQCVEREGATARPVGALRAETRSGRPRPRREPRPRPRVSGHAGRAGRRARGPED